MKIARQDQEDSLLTIFLSRQHAGPCDALQARIGFLVAFCRRSSNSALTAPISEEVALSGRGVSLSTPSKQVDAATAERQTQAFVEALRPRRAAKPVVAILALNEGTEITDFLLPYAVLRRASLADVQSVALHQGHVFLYPALHAEVTHDLASFDRAYPSGADYVIVPAMREDNNPAVIAWLKRQADRGARIIGVCAGGLVVGRAGLLDGRHFTTHWYFRSTLIKRHPSAVYVPHQRYVIDGAIATTTGITASIPTMLALVEAIGGRQKAQSLATDLGVGSWSPAHDSSLFRLTPTRGWHYLLNKAAFWQHERWSVDVHDGMDDVSLALAVDAWSRTGRVSVAACGRGPVTLRSGLVLAAQPAAPGTPRLQLAPDLKPVQQLDRTLSEIAERFGPARSEWVMMELEYAGTAR
jgi:transcriptional regulator GlxA family with amidase domain